MSSAGGWGGGCGFGLADEFGGDGGDNWNKPGEVAMGRRGREVKRDGEERGQNQGQKGVEVERESAQGLRRLFTVEKRVEER